jgi:hypothetical protein
MLTGKSESNKDNITYKVSSYSKISTTDWLTSDINSEYFVSQQRKTQCPKKLPMFICE